MDIKQTFAQKYGLQIHKLFNAAPGAWITQPRSYQSTKKHDALFAVTDEEVQKKLVECLLQGRVKVTF
jgi:hypothetical protein